MVARCSGAPSATAPLGPRQPRGAARYLFDLVCFGLLIKHGLCFVGGASQSGAVWLTPPLLFIPSTGVQAAQSRSKASKNASPGTHAQLEAQSQGDFKTAGRNSVQIKITIHIPTRTRSQYVDVCLSSVLSQLTLTYRLVATVGKFLFVCFFPPPPGHSPVNSSENLLVNCA